MEQYKKKKAEKFKKLSKKTKLGQPVMKERLHLLLEEIKEKVERWVVPRGALTILAKGVQSRESSMSSVPAWIRTSTSSSYFLS